MRIKIISFDAFRSVTDSLQPFFKYRKMRVIRLWKFYVWTIPYFLTDCELLFFFYPLPQRFVFSIFQYFFFRPKTTPDVTSDTLKAGIRRHNITVYAYACKIKYVLFCSRKRVYTRLVRVINHSALRHSTWIMVL